MYIHACWKKYKNVINSKLMVDKWTENYAEDINTGEADLEEIFCGFTEIDQIKISWICIVEYRR